MTHRIAFTNRKGGVGKSTATRELGLAMGARGKRILFIDTDPQGNLTQGLVETNPMNGVYEAVTIGELRITRINNGVNLLAGDNRLSGLEKQLIGEVDAYTRLKDALNADLLNDYDFVLIDTPPSLGVMTLNALAASTHVIIVMNPKLYTMQGTNDLLESVGKVKKSLNVSLSVLGVLINYFDPIPVIVRQIRSEIDSAFGDKVFKQVLSKSVKIEEAIASLKGVVELPAMSKTKIVEEVSSLADELILRLAEAG
jgi:chromosome partitioning protein